MGMCMNFSFLSFIFNSLRLNSQSSEIEFYDILKMDDDLKQKMDHLHFIKKIPALFLAQRFDSIINSIDFDAERIMSEFGQDSNQEHETQMVNEDRCKFVRILKLLEKDLQARLSTNGTKELGEDFAFLSGRAEAFRKISAGHEGDINDLEDSYADLILEIREMVNDEERSIFDNQSFFYVSSRDQSKLGSLFHLKDVSLTNEQIEFVKQVAFQIETWTITWSTC